MVVKGSHKHLKRFFEETGGFREEQDSGERNLYVFFVSFLVEDVSFCESADGLLYDSYRYTQSDLEWFLKQPGCEIIKVETTPGSLVLWESRSVPTPFIQLS